MRLGQLKAWVRWRDQRAVDACEGLDVLPATFSMYPATVMPDLPREIVPPSEGGFGSVPQPVPKTTEQQRQPTVDDALRTGRIVAYRVTADQRKRVDVAHWYFSSVDQESGLVFDTEEVLRNWPPRENGAPECVPRRGRRKGAGSFESQDAPLIGEMRRLIDAGIATSPYAAATTLVERAFGNGTDDAKRKRLVNRYHRRYGRD